MWIPSTSSIAIRAAPITSTNKSNALTIATWVLVIIFVGMVIARQAIKFVVLRKFGGDDFFILLSVIFGIGLSATTLILASNGLGALEPLTVARADLLMKGNYASDFLYISSLCFAKLSIVTYFYRLVVQRSQRRTVFGLGIFILVWSCASLIAVAFQCKMPRPWEMMTLNCYNSGVFWIVYCIIDMTTDVAIIMLSVNLVVYLTIKKSRKIAVVACFAPRALVIGAALARLIYIFPITPHSRPEFNLWVPIICAQIQVCLSISTACIPYMKPFFEGLEGGVWRGDDSRRKDPSPEETGTHGGDGHTYTPGHRRVKEAYSVDSTASTSLIYGRLPDVSPRIPSPAPLSPLTPPRFSVATSFSSRRSSRTPSERGLRLQIPTSYSRAANTPPNNTPNTPNTASSHALSPECVSPYSPRPLLSPPTSTPLRGPTPPPRSYTPHTSRTPTPGASHGISPITPRSPPKSPNFSLFPPPASGRYSLTPQPHPHAGVSKRRISANMSQPRGAPPRFPPRTTSLVREGGRPPTNAKFAVAPNPRNPSPSARIPSSYAIATPPSTVGTALTIPSRYLHTPPSQSASTFPPPPPPTPNPHRERNRQILIPRNSSHLHQISPVSPPSAGSANNARTFWRDDTSPESANTMHFDAPMRANRPWEIEDIPVRDARHEVRIVIRRPS